MSDEPHPCRVQGLMAAEAPVCVLLRRGPSRMTQVIRWDTATDTFEYGQWIHGRIYEYKSDVSPDGRHWVYFVLKHQEGFESKAIGMYRQWSAISRVPEFRPLRVWPQKHGWYGGGWFVTNRDVMPTIDPKEFVLEPEPAEGDFVVRPSTDPYWDSVESISRPRGWEEHTVTSMKRRADGTEQRVLDAIWCSQSVGPGLTLRRWRLKSGADKEPTQYGAALLRDGVEQHEIDACEWIDVDQRGRIVLSRAGVVYHFEESGLERPLVDLNESRPPARKPRPAAEPQD